MNRLDHLVQLISQPWAIRPEVLEGWCQILDAKLAGQEIPAEFAASGSGRSSRSDEPFERDGSLAIVPVKGTLVKANTLFSCDATYGQLKSALAAAESAKGISAVLLDGDTPGGTVAGLQETGDFIAKMNARIPVYGWVDDLAASAGYWLLSQAREIGAHAAADQGSIGVIGMHYDRSGRDAQAGIKRTVLAVGNYKAAGNDTGPMTADEQQYLMERLNQTYGLFLAAVNRGRPQLSVEKMRDMQSRVYKSSQALELGLIDRVMGRDEYIDHVKRQIKGTVAVSAKGVRAMSNLTLETLRAEHGDLVAQIEAAARVGYLAQADHDSALAAARTEGAESARTGLLELHGAVFGEEAGQKFATIVEAGTTAAQARALGISAVSGDDATRAAILEGLKGAAPEGLKPGQIVQPQQKATIDTSAIYGARQPQR